MSAPVDYFDSDSLRTDLKGKTVRGGVSTLVAQGVTLGMSLATVPVLARLLSPEDFGLLAMVAVFTGFARMFVDAGMSMATVQRETITRQQVSNLFWFAAGMGLLIGLLVGASSPLIAWFYDEPRLVTITLALCATFVLSGLAVQHQALLRRGMQLGRVSVATVVGTVCGQLAGIAWAWWYYRRPEDYFALVAIPIVTAAVRTTLLWALCPWRPGLPERGAGTRPMAQFGANLTGFATINYFVRNADNLLIGWWWGTTSLGYYAQAYRVFLTPMRSINGPLGGTMIPALSRLVDDPERYRRYYLTMVGRLALLTVPFSALVAANADLVVAAVLGAGWEPSVPILRVLATVGMVQAVSNTFGWLYTSQGRASQQLHWVMIASPLVLLSFVAGLPYGTIGVVTTYASMALLVIFPVNLLLVSREGPVRRLDLVMMFRDPVLLALAATLGSLIARRAYSGSALWGEVLAAGVGVVVAGIAAGLALPACRQLLSVLPLTVASGRKLQ